MVPRLSIVRHLFLLGVDRIVLALLGICIRVLLGIKRPFSLRGSFVAFCMSGIRILLAFLRHRIIRLLFLVLLPCLLLFMRSVRSIIISNIDC